MSVKIWGSNFLLFMPSDLGMRVQWGGAAVGRHPKSETTS
jgi:hypothetical protein